VVRVERQRAAEEEREDAGTEELVLADRPVGFAKLHAALSCQDAPVENEVDARTVVAEVSPVDDSRRLTVVVDQEMPEMEVAVHEGCGLRRAELDGGLDHLVCFLGWLPEPELGQFSQPLACLRDPNRHVRSSGRIQREVGVEPRVMKCSKELAEWSGEPGTPLVVQASLGKFAPTKEGRAVERPAVVGRRIERGTSGSGSAAVAARRASAAPRFR